jgi:hypothetical protein
MAKRIIYIEINLVITLRGERGRVRTSIGITDSARGRGRCCNNKLILTILCSSSCKILMIFR